MSEPLPPSSGARPQPGPAFARPFAPLTLRRRLKALLIFAAGLLIGMGVGFAIGVPAGPFAGPFPHRHAAMPAEAHTAMIRVENRSPIDFRNVRINGEAFGDIPAGSSSTPHRMQHLYRYAAVSLDTSSGPMALHPIDYVGERELPEGLYTYALTTDNGQLRMECVLNM